MKKFAASDLPRAKVSVLDRHTYICDLINIEGPLLCLFRDAKSNWLYLWCDTDGSEQERWLILRVKRDALVNYLNGGQSLRDVVLKAECRYLLDQSVSVVDDAEQKPELKRKLRELGDCQLIAEYMPSVDSFFDEGLSPDISLAHEVVPKKYAVPLDGDWFFSDLDKFSRLYSQLYAFFYCSKPRFVTNIGQKLRASLHAPWKGGFSRLNLFDTLSGYVPSLHDLKINRIQYASPGEVEIEALSSVGEDISSSVLGYVSNQAEIDNCVKAIGQLLGETKLRRRDLSHLADGQLPLKPENIEFLRGKTESIAKMLGAASVFSAIGSHSPNIVVTSKVVMAVTGRICKMAKLQSAGLVPYAEEDDEI